MDKYIKIQGFLNSERQIDRDYKRIEMASMCCVGRYINELQIQCCLKSEKDIDELINVLLNSKPAFNK